MAIVYSLIGQRIKEYRNKAGFSQEALAEKLGITQPFLNRLEKGKRNITLERLGQLSEILNVPIEYLVAGTVVEAEAAVDSEVSKMMKDCTESTRELILKLGSDVVAWQKKQRQ